MKLLKKIGIALLLLIVLALIVALFVPKEFTNEGTVVINKPKQEVYSYVQFLKNQDNYGVWQLSDPDMEKNFEGIDGTVGFKYSWKGKKVGTGSQTITNLVDGERMDTELDFGFGDPAKSYIVLDAQNDEQTKVTWGISGKSPYPFNLMNLCFNMDKQFEEGLQNLKTILEK